MNQAPLLLERDIVRFQQAVFPPRDVRVVFALAVQRVEADPDARRVVRLSESSPACFQIRNDLSGSPAVYSSGRMPFFFLLVVRRLRAESDILILLKQRGQVFERFAAAVIIVRHVWHLLHAAVHWVEMNLFQQQVVQIVVARHRIVSGRRKTIPARDVVKGPAGHFVPAESIPF